MAKSKSIEIAGGRTEGDVIVGNTFDKYGSKNPIVRWMMSGFKRALADFVAVAEPSTIHEVGCGEGFWVIQWVSDGRNAKGTDFSHGVIEIARKNAEQRGFEPSIFETCNIYDVEAGRHGADLVVCCEVMEHVDDPERALEALTGIVRKDLVISVPCEPLWRILNMARGKYLSDLGNTPGHINHWSTAGIKRLASRHFDVVSVAKPLPWTMLHCRRKE